MKMFSLFIWWKIVVYTQNDNADERMNASRSQQGDEKKGKRTIRIHYSDARYLRIDVTHTACNVVGQMQMEMLTCDEIKVRSLWLRATSQTRTLSHATQCERKRFTIARNERETSSAELDILGWLGLK